MGWTKLCDSFADHPKIVALSEPALRMHLRAMCYAARYKTDGLVHLAALGVPDGIRDELVTARLWDVETGGHCRIHDWGEYNISRDDDERRRERERLKKQRQRDRRRESPGDVPPPVPGGQPRGTSEPEPEPEERKTPPTPPAGGDHFPKRQIEAWNAIAVKHQLPTTQKLAGRALASLKAMTEEAETPEHLVRAFECAAAQYATMEGKRYGLRNLIRASNRGKWLDAARTRPPPPRLHKRFEPGQTEQERRWREARQKKTSPRAARLRGEPPPGSSGNGDPSPPRSTRGCAHTI